MTFIGWVQVAVSFGVVPLVTKPLGIYKKSNGVRLPRLLLREAAQRLRP